MSTISREGQIPDHTTFSRRGGGLTILPERVERNEPLHLLVDSTGIKIYGEGEWLDQKHGVRHAAAGGNFILRSTPRPTILTQSRGD